MAKQISEWSETRRLRHSSWGVFEVYAICEAINNDNCALI